MVNVITAGDGSEDSTTPHMIMSFEADQESMNQVYDIIGGGIAVALIRPRPRRGRLRLFYEEAAAAETCRVLHTRETTFTLLSTDVPSLNMTYVLDGRIGAGLAEDTDDRWVVEVGYQEIEVL